MMQNTVQTTQEELAQRIQLLENLYREGLKQLASTGLGEFGEYVFGMVPAAHHRIWLKLLENTGFQRVIIVAPPGHAKSTWCSVIYPAWRIGTQPSIHYLGTSITSTQSDLFSVAIRDTISNSPHFKEIFPAVVPEPSKGWGESEWFVGPRDTGDPHATYAASGVGGAVIGRRADEIGLDDPYDEKNSATELQREKVITWLKRTLRSRLVPGGRFRAVLTRWHYDDLVKEFEESPSYTIVRMIALSDGKEVWAEAKFARRDRDLADEVFKDQIEWTERDAGQARLFIHDQGPALWPEYWSEGDLEDERFDMGDPLFNCMYQGDPSALSGKIFSIDDFQDIPADFDPDHLVQIGQFWDTALSAKDSASFSACATGGNDAENNFYVLKVRRNHVTSLEQRQMIENAWYEDTHTWPKLNRIGVEKGLLSIGLLEELATTTDLPIREQLPKGDKVARARPVAARGASGKVFVDKGASWWKAFLAEFLAFDRGKWDDQVDAVSGLYYMLFMGKKRWRKSKFLRA